MSIYKKIFDAKKEIGKISKTKQWQNIEVAVSNGKIDNIKQIEQVYKISKETREKLEKLIS